MSKLIKFWFLGLCLFSSQNLWANDAKVLTAGWYHWAPYQYIDESGKLTGLDVALVRAIFNSQGFEVNYVMGDADTWEKNQKDVLEGTKDIAAGAFDSEFRQANYHVSEPYRFEWNSLYVRREALADFDVSSIDRLIDLLIEKRLRLGVIGGYTYTTPELNTYIAEQVKSASGLVVAAATEEENFNNIVNEEVDIVVSDRLVGARIVWSKNLGGTLSEHPVKLTAKPIHLLIHRSKDPVKNAANLKLLDAFNQGTQQLTVNGQINNIIGNYLFPVLMNITVQTDWFFTIDIIGAIFFAMAGLFIARDKSYDFFGTLVMTALFVAGGGLIRDLIVGRHPAILATNHYISIIVIGCCAGFTLQMLHQFLELRVAWYRKVIARHSGYYLTLRRIMEAIALGAYTIVGVGVAIETRLEPLWLWGPLLGCLTSCGGGLIASALNGVRNTNMLGGIEPEASLFWGMFFSLFMVWQIQRLNPSEVFIGVMVTLAGCAVTSLTLSHFQIRSYCMQKTKYQSDSPHQGKTKGS